MMDNLLDLQKHCVGKRLEGGGQTAHDWRYRTPQGRFNPRRKYKDHGQEPSPIHRMEFIGWYQRIDGTKLGGS